MVIGMLTACGSNTAPTQENQVTPTVAATDSQTSSTTEDANTVEGESESATPEDNAQETEPDPTEAPLP